MGVVDNKIWPITRQHYGSYQLMGATPHNPTDINGHYGSTH